MAGLASVLVFLLLWEAAARLFQVRAIMLPLPGQVALELASEWAWYAGHAAYTLMTTLAGFALAVAFGVLTAVMLVGSRWFERFIYPLIVALNSVPKVAIAPLFVIWMGTGAEPKIAIAFLIAVFAMIVDTVHGLRSVPQDVLDLGRVLKGLAPRFLLQGAAAQRAAVDPGRHEGLDLAGPGRRHRRRVRVPQRGLGYVIMSAQGTFDTVRVFAAIFVLALMGMALFSLLVWLERRLTPWLRHHREDG